MPRQRDYEADGSCLAGNDYQEGFPMSKSVMSALFMAAALASLTLVGLAQDPAAQSKILVGHSDPVYSVDFTPDGALIVTGSFDKTLKLWDAATTKPLRTFT